MHDDDGRRRRGEAGRGRRRRDLRGSAVNLPDWVIRDLERVTPRERIGPALEELGAASAALAEGRFPAALRHARRAKELAPRDVTVRETLGIAAYRVGDWNLALRELRAYRRLAGDTRHLPVEMDVLRALERPRDLERAWQELRRRGGRPEVLEEGRVVYASHLLDTGRVAEAWELTRPERLEASPSEARLRVWYVAARAAARRGDARGARRLADAIVSRDPGFPGIDELEEEIAAAGA